ncbi:MAG TPA: efflux RND transporter periplasmic adaptor subunit [Gammaproteobacteria bacterium]|nr:efflux RND transporter periplasmic adaptor subunit [Gammaproteobacteria bacterium]
MAQEEGRENTPDRQPRRRRIALGSLAVMFAVAGAAYSGYWLTAGRYHESTEDAYVAGNRVPVMAEIHGTVVALMADNTMPVRQGQTIVRLDDTDARVALEQAEAKLASTVRRIQGEYAKEKQLEAEAATRKASLALAETDYRRSRNLHAKGVTSTQVLEHSATSVEVNRHEAAAAERALEVLRADLGATGVAHHPDVKLAAAEVRAAYLALERTKIVAPIAGFVANRNVQVGQQVDPGAPLMAIVPRDEVWVEANFKESQLDGIRIGQAVLMHADAYGGSVAFHGKVIGIGAGTGSAFSVLPPQNATGNWIKVVQRVPVRIGIARTELERHRLQIGLSMDVTVDTRADADPNETSRALDIVDPAGYTTSVYDSRGADADGLIARIIAANVSGEADQRPAGLEKSPGGNEKSLPSRTTRFARETGLEADAANAHGG